MRLASRVGLVLCALIGVFWKHPAFGVALDTEGEIKLGTRIYTAARLGTEHTDSPSTFPYSTAGHLRQHRTFIEAEFDHNLMGLTERGFAPLAFLKDLPFGISRLKYHLTYRGEMEGIYDYGPKEFRTADQFQELPQALVVPPGNPNFQQDFIAGKRRTLRDRATQRHRLFQAFMDLQAGDLFIRFGRQILSWGETDNFRVLDNINPLDSSFGGFLVSLDERRVPLDMLRTNYFLGSYGPFDQAFVEGYMAVDNEWGSYPGIPQGSPWQLPNLGRPNSLLTTATTRPPATFDNARGGAQLKFNAPIPFLGDGTFGIAHYYTYFDNPVVQVNTVALPVLNILANPALLNPDGSAAVAVQSASLVQVTGASSTFVIPSQYARKIFLGGEPVIRTELAYFKDEPRWTQTQLDPFFFNVQRFQVNPAIAQQNGDRGSGDSWNFVLGVDMNQFIPWLNAQSSFFFSTQFFYKHLNGARKRQFIKVDPNDPNSPDYIDLVTMQPILDGEVLPVPESTNALGQPQLVHNPTDQFLQTLLISTSYASGQVVPSLTLFYDWFGAFVAIPAVTLSRDPFRFTIQYNFLNASRLRGASGTSLLRDRDNVLFQFEYVL